MAGGNYVTKLMTMLRKGEITMEGTQHARVVHDSWCLVFAGGECDCDPEITVEKVQSVEKVGA
jgi:hypothetical protein